MARHAELVFRGGNVITLGAALLGFLAGEMIFTDPATIKQFGELSHTVVNAAGIAGALLVVGLGRFLQRRQAAKHSD